MFKPKLVGNILHNGFAEQERQVSIAVDMFDFNDDSPYRVFMQLEPNDIVPTEQKLIDNHTFFDLILSWNERVLQGCPHNSVKFIFGTCRWATNPVDACDVSQKKFAVSYLTSNKTMCHGHMFRHEIFNNLPAQVGQLEITKHMSPPTLECKRPMLYPFQYSIVMENGRYNNWITEKLIDCLVSRTIPIYWGAKNVGEYFDKDGILEFESYRDLMHILENLTPEFYKEHLDAIENNLHEAMKYTDVHKRVDSEIRKRLNGDFTRAVGYQSPGKAVRERMLKRK